MVINRLAQASLFASSFSAIRGKLVVQVICEIVSSLDEGFTVARLSLQIKIINAA